MLFPLLSEYIDAILCPEDNLDRLKGLVPVLDKGGRPVMSSGNFAVVFKMIDLTGHHYALKCFLRDQEDRSKKYKIISNKLEVINSPYFITVKYYENELFVSSVNTDREVFPVLLMDWIDGVTLSDYLRQNLESDFRLKYLAFSFGKMARWLLDQDFAHGDIKPDNILVKPDGGLFLIDYDGMYVPGLKSCRVKEIGSPNYRHPLRSTSDFGKDIDDFSLVVILLSLKIISNNPSIWNRKEGEDVLLFDEKDYSNLLQSDVIRQIYPSNDTEINRLLGLLLVVLSQKSINGIDHSFLEINNPIDGIIKKYQSGETIIYPTGLVYSADKKCLISGKDCPLQNVELEPGLLFIADRAFEGNKNIKSIHLPNSIQSIGSWAFSDCSGLETINIPELLHFSHRVFYNCTSLKVINSKYYSDDNHGLVVHGELVAVISSAMIDELVIPRDIIEIGPGAFSFCKKINTLRLSKELPRGVYSFEDASIQRLDHPNATEDGHCLIDGGKLIQFVSAEQINYSIPSIVYRIETHAFSHNHHLESIVIPASVTELGQCAFYGCTKLSRVVFSNNLKSIGDLCFGHCSSLKAINIPDSVTTMGGGTFCNCTSLIEVMLPNSLKQINNITFENCHSLLCIQIPDSVEVIKKRAFAQCTFLQEVSFGESLSEIWDSAFSGCINLRCIRFKSASISISQSAFIGCKSLNTIYIPNGSIDTFRKIMTNSFGKRVLHRSLNFIEYQ